MGSSSVCAGSFDGRAPVALAGYLMGTDTMASGTALGDTPGWQHPGRGS